MAQDIYTDTDTDNESGGFELTHFQRFSAAQRFEHVLLAVTFIGLALTGLPQRYAAESWAQEMVNIMGGIESVRIMHRVFAVGLLINVIYHGGVVSYKFLVLRHRMDMLPSLQDFYNVRDWVLHNLGLRKEMPKMPRYNFGEKAEYLALVWGTLIMVITGYILWNPIAANRLLPGSFIPAARYAHSAEAFLAVASIVIWHLYNTVIKTFNASIFTGKMSREEMEEEHAHELELIEKGEIPPPPPPEVIARRRRWFIPYATVMTVVLLAALYWFVTFEETAIVTILPEPVAADELILNISADAGDASLGAAVWQSLECMRCHGENAEGAPGALNVALAATPLDFETFVLRVRTGPADMRAYSPADVTNLELAHVYAWVQTPPPE